SSRTARSTRQIAPARLPCDAVGPLPSATGMPGSVVDRRGAADLGKPIHVNLQPFHAPRIGIEHLELDTGRMPHQLAARRHATDKREHKATQRVDLLL